MKTLFLSFLMLFLISCSNDDHTDNQFLEDIQVIKQYLLDNNINAIETSSGLHYVIHNSGTEERPTPEDCIRLDGRISTFEGEVLDDFLNDENIIVILQLKKLLPGLIEGYQLLGEGGHATLYLPSRLAYGPDEIEPPFSNIDNNTPLIFDIKLLYIADCKDESAFHKSILVKQLETLK